jgi:ATP-dependent helicase/nuclease subunit B
MTTEILLAPAATGKTEYAIERLLSVVAEPFASAWVLLASVRQEDAFRARLLQTGGKQVYFNIEFFDFYKLYHRLLNIAGQPVRALDQTGRFRLLRAVLEGLQANRELKYFNPIAHTPGFVREIANFIDELKQGVVPIEWFKQQAETRKDKELALIYEAYQQRLIVNQLVDREGEGWLALDVLRQDDKRLIEGQPLHLKLPLKLLLVDGFDQLSPLQASLIARLSGRAGQALVTLTTVTEREDTIGRRFKQALERLKEVHVSEAQPEPKITVLSATRAEDGRAPDMRQLLASIFKTSAAPVEWQRNVHMLEAPDPAREVAAVLRRVKRLLLAGCSPDDILIALRDWVGYGAHFATFMRTYGLPLALHYGEPLTQNATVIALLNLLALHSSDFKRRDLLDALRSPYFTPIGMDSAHLDALERVSHALLVISGRETWLEALGEAAHVKGEDEDDSETIIEAALAAHLKEQLRAFFDAVTPPAQASVSEYVHWIERLIGPDPQQSQDEKSDINTELTAKAQSAQSDEAVYRLRMLENVRKDALPYIVSRDIAAMQAFKRVLRGLLSGQELLKTLGEDKPVMWATFFADLRAAVETESVNSAPLRSGRVLVTTAANARGLPHKHLFVLGLSEGLFPMRQPEDALYTDKERLRLKDKKIPLLTRAERAVDDGLFYELIGLPRETLTLSRPYLEKGSLWIESHLWRAVRQVFSSVDVERVAAGTVVRAEEAASQEEAALALAAALSAKAQGVSSLKEAGLYNWILKQHGDYWAHIRLGRSIEARRMSHQPHDAYSGRLRDAVLVEHVAKTLGANRAWSASQLNEFGQCGFRFFAKRLLKLEKLEEPEEGMNALVLGSLYHKILENTYMRLAATNTTITLDNMGTALDILREEAARVLANAPREMHFRATPVWEGEKRVILRRLEAIVRKDFSEDSPLNRWSAEIPRRPYQLEAPFGIDAPLTIDLPDGERLRMRGFIDRIDRQGDAAIVVDYKSGSTKIPVSEMQIGRNFQMMLYLLALPQILAAVDAPKHVLGGMFWHIRSGETSGEVTSDHEAIDEARAHLSAYLQAGRVGDFAAIATKTEEGKCTRYCEFAQMCRIAVMNRNKR